MFSPIRFVKDLPPRGLNDTGTQQKLIDLYKSYAAPSQQEGSYYKTVTSFNLKVFTLWRHGLAPPSISVSPAPLICKQDRNPVYLTVKINKANAVLKQIKYFCIVLLVNPTIETCLFVLKLHWCHFPWCCFE